MVADVQWRTRQEVLMKNAMILSAALALFASIARAQTYHSNYATTIDDIGSRAQR